jgi:biopolymer transport protein ExbD
MRFQLKKRRQPIFNIIPLIDILTILLLFFITTSVFRHPEPVVQIKLPESTQAKPSKESPPLLIYVTGDEKLFLDNQQIAIDLLPSLLKQRTKATPDLKVALKADKKASFGLIVKVMDAAKIAGLQNLPTYTEEAKDAPPP